jgi:hypothetical protein
MFSRIRAYEFRASYMSRYSYMMETGDPVDRANSEAARLASQAWQDLAQFMQRPDLKDEHGNDWEFDPEEVITDIQLQWEDYCRTGVARNDVDELASEIRARHPQELAARRKAYMDRNKVASRDPVQDFGIQPLESKEAQAGGQKGKKVKKSEISSDLPAESQTSVSQEEQIDEVNRSYIQENALDVVIAEIRMELGIDMQELQSQTI